MPQALLFPDPRPLDQRLGKKFFRKAPRRPGVYLMRDANDRVIYVGKAKDLRQRLNNYRLANPDRMPRRHLRMVREVSRIEFQFCANEAAALRKESELLRSLRPKFNRAGVWPGKTWFVVWRAVESKLELGVAEIPAPGWHRFGPLNSGARGLHQSCCRLLWLALNPHALITGMPAGWLNGRLPEHAEFDCSDDLEFAWQHFFWEDAWLLPAWLRTRLEQRTHAFERAIIEADMEILRNFAEKREQRITDNKQLGLM